MLAKLTVCLAGDPMREIGEVVSGEEAVRLCAAGFAVPIKEERATPETAALKARAPKKN
jgi:hypothetical protein